MQRKSNESLQPLNFHASKIPQSSSDDYKVDDELFNDVEMQDAPDMVTPQKMSDFPRMKEVQQLSIPTENALDRSMASSDSNESLEEQYQTPPDSPSKVSLRQLQMKKSGTSPTTKPVQINIYGGISERQNRKRTYPAPPKPDMPRKMSRDNSNSRTLSASSVQASGAMTHMNAPNVRNIHLDEKRSGDSLHKSFSSGSFTSVTSTAATMASSAWTTPNTSFRTETPSTSFDSSEPFELDDFGGKSMHSRRSWQNLKAPFGLGLDVGLDSTSHGPTKAGSMGPPVLVPTTRKSPEISAETLLSVSPFGKSLICLSYHLLMESKMPYTHSALTP